jgi:hypothetical protein
VNSSGYLSTLVGGWNDCVDGPASSARFNRPTGITEDSFGNLYIVDVWNGLVRKIDPFGTVSSVGIGNGCGIPMFNDLDPNASHGIVADSSGNLFMTHYSKNLIHKINTTGHLTVFAGGESGWSDGQGTAARFAGPTDITIDSFGNLFVVDTYNYAIRKVNASGFVTTIAGTPGLDGHDDGPALTAKFYAPEGITIDSAGNLYVSCTDRIRMIFMGALL